MPAGAACQSYSSEDRGFEEPSEDERRGYTSFPTSRPNEGPAVLQAIFRVLESRGPKESMNLLRDVMESMKLVQAITGTGAAASFVHANTYADTRGEAFGILTGLSTLLSMLSLIVTVTVYVSIGLLEHDDMEAVEGYLSNYWHTIGGTIGGSLLSMMLLVSAVIVDAFRAYSKAAAISLLATCVIGVICIVVFFIHSTRYVFSTGVSSQERKAALGKAKPIPRTDSEESFESTRRGGLGAAAAGAGGR